MEGARWVDRSNLVEAQYIVAMLKDFFATRKEEETIGVITFNTGQRDLIDDMIDAQCEQDADFAAAVREELGRRKDGEDIGLFVKNIESVQGDERDVILFSVGYAPNEKGTLARNFGWLNQRGGENRLNVAISRRAQTDSYCNVVLSRGTPCGRYPKRWAAHPQKIFGIRVCHQRWGS